MNPLQIFGTIVPHKAINRRIKAKSKYRGKFTESFENMTQNLKGRKKQRNLIEKMKFKFHDELLKNKSTY